MTTLALAAPTTPICGGNAATVLPATETPLGTNTGFSFPNNGSVVLRVCIGAAGAGNLTLTIQKTVEGQTPPPITIAVANSTNYQLGPFRPSDFNDANGLFQGALSVQTGNSVGVYSLPGSQSGN